VARLELKVAVHLWQQHTEQQKVRRAANFVYMSGDVLGVAL
jgi:hypothetical protein